MNKSLRDLVHLVPDPELRDQMLRKIERQGMVEPVERPVVQTPPTKSDISTLIVTHEAGIQHACVWESAEGSLVIIEATLHPEAPSYTRSSVARSINSRVREHIPAGVEFQIIIWDAYHSERWVTVSSGTHTTLNAG